MNHNVINDNNFNETCPFCLGAFSNILIDGNYAYVVNDNYPVSAHHSLVITKRHCENYFDLASHELQEIHELLKKRRIQILDEDNTVTGFNIGVNIGETGGQSVFHLHFHLIPRRKGDCENPKGGVRGVIPEKQAYSEA